jgi:hypothetical protein
MTRLVSQSRTFMLMHSVARFIGIRWLMTLCAASGLAFTVLYLVHGCTADVDDVAMCSYVKIRDPTVRVIVHSLSGMYTGTAVTIHLQILALIFVYTFRPG